MVVVLARVQMLIDRPLIQLQLARDPQVGQQPQRPANVRYIDLRMLPLHQSPQILHRYMLLDPKKRVGDNPVFRQHFLIQLFH